MSQVSSSAGDSGSERNFRDRQQDKSAAFMLRIQSDPMLVYDDAAGEFVVPSEASDVQNLNKFPHPYDADEANVALNEIKLSFDRSNSAAYRTLGLIHETCPCFPIGQSAHEVLVAAVKETAEGESNRSIEDRPAYLLFLDLLYGTENKRSQKTQWRAALEAATDNKVPSSQLLFMEWIEGKGGIAGVGKLKNPEQRGSKVDVADAANALSERFNGLFTLPPVRDADKDHGRFATIVVRLPDDYDPQVEAPVTIVGVDFTPSNVDQQITALYHRIETSTDRQNRKAATDEDAPYLETLKKLRRGFKARRARALNPEEFMEEKVSELGDHRLAGVWARRETSPAIWRKLRLG